MDVSQQIARCYDTHARALYAHALVMTSDPADAEEVLQNVFARLIRRPEALQSARDDKAVLMKWVHDAAVDLIRSKRGPLVMEVNSSPGLEGIEGSTKVGVAGKIIEFIERNVEADNRDRIKG